MSPSTLFGQRQEWLLAHRSLGRFALLRLDFERKTAPLERHTERRKSGSVRIRTSIAGREICFLSFLEFGIKPSVTNRFVSGGVHSGWRELLFGEASRADCPPGEGGSQEE